MTTKSPYLRNCTMSALLVGACGTLWGCGARSVMEKPEDDLPTLPGTGGAPTTGGTAGTFQATGGTFWATGGSGGTPATGGTGGGFIGSCEYPSCLWNLIRDCQVVGPCTGEEAQPAGSSTDIWEHCCSNGVDELTTIQTQGSKVTATVAVTKNGNKCYDVNVTTSADGSTLNYVWLDPSGQAVAKASISLWALGPSVLECGNGESMPMTNTCQPDGSQAAVITTGTCR